MTEPMFGDLDQALAAFKRDLIADDGPQISTMRNYRFAILPYLPSEEFKLRQRILSLTEELRAEGWAVLPISLQQLLLERIRGTGQEVIDALIARERRLYERDPERALAHIREKIAPHIEGPDGIAGDVARLIREFADQHPDMEDRSLVIIGRAGALYPFFRSSALLKHIDGKTRNLPVVLLYPGKREDQSGLSFMCELPADRDYRPRIYP
ncbi:MAG: DUF1788 domain-containing protein [Polyangiaceae bacterium]|nr:DUF1788 domain-containing protein [Polyangiaceae bacterium]